MKYKDVVDNLVIIAIAINFLEKVVSYIGQKNFPNTIGEGRVATAQLIGQYGLEGGHIVAFVITVVAIICLRYTFVYISPKLERYRIWKNIVMGISILGLVFIIAMSLYIAYNNIRIVWLNL
jgi:uncharacterized membrane protein YagU involved in acid resistance